MNQSWFLIWKKKRYFHSTLCVFLIWSYSKIQLDHCESAQCEHFERAIYSLEKVQHTGLSLLNGINTYMFTSARHFAPQQAFYTMSYMGVLFFPEKVSIHTVMYAQVCYQVLSTYEYIKYLFFQEDFCLKLHFLLHSIFCKTPIPKECFYLCNKSYLFPSGKKITLHVLTLAGFQTKDDCCFVCQPPCAFWKSWNALNCWHKLGSWTPLLCISSCISASAWEEEHVLHI